MKTIKLLGMALFIALPLHAVAAPVDKDIIKDMASLRQQSCPGDATNVQSLEKNIESDALYEILWELKYGVSKVLNTGLYPKAIRIAPKYADCQNSNAWAEAIKAHLYADQA
ncbi:Uncharacterised protein [Buttiauxella agrestis]|uniref:Uncharacterized protein n=1 Tax=Buttiauxella agrestis TaxID=82977 RepID=A0A381KQE8_9ENTR|nr:hypothetical protein [Buttiauxella agrestis]SUY92831.1 Uncharacterised protein [Buttiauxella agrestis]